MENVLPFACFSKPQAQHFLAVAVSVAAVSERVAGRVDVVEKGQPLVIRQFLAMEIEKPMRPKPMAITSGPSLPSRCVESCLDVMVCSADCLGAAK